MLHLLRSSTKSKITTQHFQIYRLVELEDFKNETWMSVRWCGLVAKKRSCDSCLFQEFMRGIYLQYGGWLYWPALLSGFSKQQPGALQTLENIISMPVIIYHIEERGVFPFTWEASEDLQQQQQNPSHDGKAQAKLLSRRMGSFACSWQFLVLS